MVRTGTEELSRSREAMYAIGLKGDDLFGSRGYHIAEVRVCGPPQRVWEVYPNDVAPPRTRDEKVWGVLVGQLIVVDGQTCSSSSSSSTTSSSSSSTTSRRRILRAHLLAVVMHKVMQAAAFNDRARVQNGSADLRRAFDAVCNVGVYCALQGFDTGGDAEEEAALEDQRRAAIASSASVTACSFVNAVRAAYGRSRILTPGGESKLVEWHTFLCERSRRN
jgi:hypothetical protein